MNHTPDWWAITERVAARPKPTRPARPAVAPAPGVPRSAAVRPSSRSEFDRLLGIIAEQVQRAAPVVEVAPPAGTPVAESEPAPVAVPAKPLHEMSPDEFRHHVATAWDRLGEYHRPLQPRPAVSLGQFLRDGN